MAGSRCWSMREAGAVPGGPLVIARMKMCAECPDTGGSFVVFVRLNLNMYRNDKETHEHTKRKI